MPQCRSIANKVDNYIISNIVTKESLVQSLNFNSSSAEFLSFFFLVAPHDSPFVWPSLKDVQEITLNRIVRGER